MENPWALVTPAEYEAHLGPEGTGLAGPLAAIAGKALAALRPARLLVLGVATGNGLEHVDLAVTRRVVGVDLSLASLAVARQRHLRLGAALELYCGDVERVALGGGPFDLALASLLFEHVDAARVARRVAAWLAPGGALVAVLRPPGGRATPAATAALRAVEAAARPVSPAALAAHLAAAGMGARAPFEVPVAGGERLHVGHFRKPK
jgi:hypothetical protein